ncbi:MAG: hypothetical protein KDA85_15275, partial [Planctomycetaceae bacterium]|nr:hypothetical protein [Planctomycetaceae bacterium]
RRIAETSATLTVHRVASGTEVALQMCQDGVWYDELMQFRKVRRASDGSLLEEKGPGDTTQVLADTLTSGDADLFVTSGHATERDWQIGFRYRNGQFRSKAGQMFGHQTNGSEFRIHSEHPRVYLPIGNCLMGHIDGSDAMALAWMNDVGVRQMIGYTVVTWYGYAGWGVLDYFVEQPGRYSLTEAFHANQHALMHRLTTNFDDLANVAVDYESRRLPSGSPNAAGKQRGLTADDARGLLWDRDCLAFYGDPGWQARMAPQPCAFEQSLTRNGDLYTFTITPRRDRQSFAPVNTNGSQRGGRPIVQLLARRLQNLQLLEGSQWAPVLADDFVLVPNPGPDVDPQEITIRFSASSVK